VIAPPREIVIAAAAGGPSAVIDDGDGAADLGVESVEDDVAAPWRPRLTVADVFRVFGPASRRQVGSALTNQQDRVLRELLVWRSEVFARCRPSPLRRAQPRGTCSTRRLARHPPRAR
jgi:hypothetical protein